MFRRTTCLGTLFGSIVMAWLLPAAPASAGGWWSHIQVERQYVGVGETLVTQSEAFFSTLEQAERARTKQYYAYLVRSYDNALLRRAMTERDPKRWWATSPDARLVRVGRVRLGGWNANVGEAHARIKIPKIGTGRWSLMFCDAGCREPMASVTPTSVRVTADVLTAKAANRMAALEERARIVPDLRAELRAARSAAANAATAAENARRELNSVRGRVLALEAAARQPSSSPAWPWSVAGALALLMLAIIVAIRRRSGSADRAGALQDDARAVGADWEPPRPLAKAARSSGR